METDLAQATDATGRAEAPAHYHYEVSDASPAAARALRQRINGCHWTFATQLLDILDWVCPTERQHEHARRKALDLINGQERAMAAIINRALAPEASDAAAR